MASTSSFLLWNETLGSWEDQMGVRSQFENKTCLLSYKDMLMGREQRAHKRNQVKVANEKLRMTERRVPLSVCHLDLEKKVCFKVKISSHGKWNSNDCDNCQIAGAILKGKRQSLRSLISPEWNHIKCLMISSIYSNEALGAFLMERCHHQSWIHSLSVGNILLDLTN